MTRRSSLRARAREIYFDMVDEADSAMVPARATRLTTRVRALYEDSAVPVREIARLAGVTERTIYKYAAKHGWKPRYRWMADGTRPKGTKRYAGTRAKRGRSWQHAPGVKPAKGAGGRFIRREDKGKRIARGLKASDPKGARRAAAHCDEAEALAREAQGNAEKAVQRDGRRHAMAAAIRALENLVAYRAQRAHFKRQGGAGTGSFDVDDGRPPPGDDPVGHGLALSYAAARDWLKAAQASESGKARKRRIARPEIRARRRASTGK